MDSHGKISHRCVMRMSLNVVLLDDLTGRPVTGSNARAWIENAKPPIKKDDGRFIFTDLPEGEYTVLAEGGTFCRSEVNCVITPDRAEYVTLRLLPNSLYPTPSDCIRIAGVCEPGALVAVYSSDKTAAYKLLSDVKKGAETVGIYHPDTVNIEGKLLRIISKGKGSEFIRIKSISDPENSEYALFGKISGSYPKVGTMLAEASEVKADEKGKFTVLIKSRPAEDAGIVCELVGVKGSAKEFPLEGKSFIKVDMTE